MKRMALRVSEMAIEEVRLMIPRAKRWIASAFPDGRAAGADVLAAHICMSASADVTFEDVSEPARTAGSCGAVESAAEAPTSETAIEGPALAVSEWLFASATLVTPSDRAATRIAVPKDRYTLPLSTPTRLVDGFGPRGWP